MKNIASLGLFIFFFFSFLSVRSQESTFQLWLDYDHQNKIDSKWRFFSDYGVRSQFNDWLRLHARPSFGYKSGSKIDYRAGVGFFYLFDSYDNNVFELRPWQGVLLSLPNIDRFHFKNYIRLEERFVTAIGLNYNNFILKLRYKIGLAIPLNNFKIIPKTFYIPVSFEMFFNLAFEEQPINNDRLRFEVGLGYMINEKTRITCLYTLQEVYYKENNYIDFGEGFAQIDNVLRITLSQRFGFEN